MIESLDTEQEIAEREVECFQSALGPFVVAAENTRMPMVFTNAKVSGNPIIFANDSFLALMGYDRMEVLAQGFAFVMAHKGGPDGRASIDAVFRGNSDETIDVECRRKCGQTFLAAIYISPVHDEHGIVVQHFASFVDLTKRLEWLQTERDAVHALYQNTPGFIAITEGPDHRFTYANASFQKLVGHKQIVGKSVAELLPELIDQGFIGRLDEVYVTGHPFFGAKMPIKIQHEADAEWDLRFIDFAYQPIRNAHNDVTGLFCAGNDVTEHKLALARVLSLQAELIHVSRVTAMGTMATTLAHELNQPLTAISNYAEACLLYLKAGASDGNILSADLLAIGESSIRAGKIIHRLRDMTQGRATKRSVFDLNDAVDECIDLVRAGSCQSVSIEGKGNGSAMVEADRVQIQQVIMNLAKNGCEAAAESKNGHVTVSTRVEGDRAVVSVDDTGPGVVPEAAGALFQWSNSTKPDGMGVGLSISRTIMEVHQGSIWLEASGEGHTRFCFSLPIAEQLRANPEGGKKGHSQT